MAKKQSDLSVRKLQTEKKEKRISTKKINFSDIPNSND